MNKQFSKRGSANTILVVLVVIAAFLIGSLWTRIQFMEKNGTPVNNAVGNVAVNNPSPQAQPTPDLSKLPPITDQDHIKGDKNAVIALVEYSDFECPFCKQFHPTVTQIIDEYKGKVKLIYRHYPLPFHQNAEKEAEASECAAELGGNEAFWKFSDAIYERTTSNGTGFALDKLQPLAEEIGLDGTKFQSCLDSGKYAKQIADMTSGGQKAGIQGTPGTVILNTKTNKTSLVPGAVPVDQLKTMIDALLK